MHLIDWLLVGALAGCAAYAILCRFIVIANSTAPLLLRLTVPLIPIESLNEIGRVYQRRLLLTALLGVVLGALALVRTASL